MTLRHPGAERVVVLGCSGSIGTQAADVIERSDGRLQCVGLAAGRDWRTAVEQARRLGVDRIAIADPDGAREAAEAFDGQVLSGPDGVLELAIGSGADLVLNAIVGAAGLGSTLAALGEGIDVALANKESLVVGGQLVTGLAEATGARLWPVDSEHTALAQLLAATTPGEVRRLIVTASGGPFREWGADAIAGATVEQALAHPTWRMGGKITIDSATMMNKGLELIEAHHLFGVPMEKIDVLVHPQSIIHGLVDLHDGAQLAHLGHPDMRVAISWALHRGTSVSLPTKTLDLAEVGQLTFEAPDEARFPCLRLAREAQATGGGAPCVLNAANEVAVHAFLDGRVPFGAIPEVVEATLERDGDFPVSHASQLLAIDRRARETAEAIVDRLVAA
ncbi:MAG: 1-deoxy-D-xylulose-5-phosphate reductoisomerase [Solirubrobacteraceae bacterium]|nr:1-deoxy-D-xylulose-5-phosphate reductoisomerase [Solirubrobacteraceae bacterium]